MIKILTLVLLLTLPVCAQKNLNTIDSKAQYDTLSVVPEFSKPAGFYQGQFYLKIYDSTSSGIIYYTNNGSIPGNQSQQFRDSILISKTVVLKARIINETAASQIVTKTYFVNESITLPVVSISTDSLNFWDPDSGIYDTGRYAQSEYPYYGANYWQDWERPIHFELFEPDGTNPLSMDAGVKIFGGEMRTQAERSLSIFARSKYESGSIKYRIFPWLPIKKYESFVLRNAGNDWQYTMLRDGLMTNIAGELGVDVQAFRPSVVFINGNYWGIHNIREKVNEHYLASHYNLNPDSVNLLEYRSTVLNGSGAGYGELISYVSNSGNKLYDSAAFDYVKNRVDIDEFITYMVCQIYFDNTDWPGNNIKFWNSTAPVSKWRWIMFDTDFGFGIYGHDPANRTLTFATEANGPSWPNPPWSTILFRRFLENTEFKNQFINRFSDLCNTSFTAEIIKGKIDSLAAIISNEIARHKQRWGQSYEGWKNEIQIIKNYADIRKAGIRADFQDKFGLTGLSTILINSDAAKGRVRLNSLTLNNFPWSGSYFNGIPVTLTAVPLPGYKFSNWEGISSSSISISIMPESLSNVIAVFEPDTATVWVNDFLNLPGGFKLEQNYPNPFNPTTNISFALSRASHIKLLIYDMLGREAAILSEGNYEVGYHTTEFNGESLSSGMYYYRLIVDNKKSLVRKMLLIK